MINEHEYGNGVSIYTRDGDAGSTDGFHRRLNFSDRVIDPSVGRIMSANVSTGERAQEIRGTEARIFA